MVTGVKELATLDSMETNVNMVKIMIATQSFYLIFAFQMAVHLTHAKILAVASGRLIHPIITAIVVLAGVDMYVCMFIDTHMKK